MFREKMSDATCVNEASYSGALTRGKRYAVLASDESRQQIRVKGDNGRVRWFPSSLFDVAGADVAVLTHITIKDSVEAALTVEVDVELSDGQRRWCFFTTPNALQRLSQTKLGTETLFMYGAPHMIVVSAINEDVIAQALKYIDSHNELLECTRPID